MPVPVPVPVLVRPQLEVHPTFTPCVRTSCVYVCVCMCEREYVYVFPIQFILATIPPIKPKRVLDFAAYSEDYTLQRIFIFSVLLNLSLIHI